MTRRLQTRISGSLSSNVEILQTRFANIPELVIRVIQIKRTKQKAAVAYLDGLVDKNSVNNHLLDPLIHDDKEDLPVGESTPMADWEAISNALFEGCSILFLDGSTEVYAYDTQGHPQRAISDPQTETALKSAHQGFVETLSQNIAMLRRYIPNRELKEKQFVIGERGKAKIVFLYLEDVVNPELVQTLEERLKKIRVDSLSSTGELEEYIESHPYSPFPQIQSTERPDATSSHLLQGRIAIMMDRSPMALITPVTFFTFFQNVDDYNIRWATATFLRLLRLFAFLIAVFLPSLYISVISFNYEVIPLDLILNIGESRARVPFPTLLEALIMELSLEMLREAGLRLPAPLGQTVGIVGGIVIGEAAVNAGIVSNIMVIVVAMTAIASFIIPNIDMSSAIRLIRFPMMVMAALFGVVGLVVGMMILIAHVVSLESLQTPFGSPLAPFRLRDWRDTIFRLPLWLMRLRPTSTDSVQERRQDSDYPEENNT